MIEQLPNLDIREYKYEIPDPLVVFERFAESELGKELHGRTRFHVFQKDVPSKKWIERGGPDIDNLAHMMVTYRLTEAFLASSKGLSEREKKLLLFTAIVHDMGEVVDGDIPEPQKTEEQHEEEMRMFSGILEYYTREDMGEFERYNLIGDVVDVMSERDTKLGKAFNAIENLGYSMTALNSWREYRMLEHGEERQMGDGFRALAHEVTLKGVPLLVNYSKEYPYINSYLIQNGHYIFDILNDAEETGAYDKFKIGLARIALDEANASHAS